METDSQVLEVEMPEEMTKKIASQARLMGLSTGEVCEQVLAEHLKTHAV